MTTQEKQNLIIETARQIITLGEDDWTGYNASVQMENLIADTLIKLKEDD